MRRDWSWAAMIFGVGALATVLGYSYFTPAFVKKQVETEVADVAPRIVQTALAERRPPMVFHSVRLFEPMVFRGRHLEIEYVYDKRAECTPELGTGRHIYYAWVNGEIDGNFYTMPPFKSADREPSGLAQTATAMVSTLETPPGNYAFQMVSTFSCAGEAGQLVARSKPVPFQVLPPA